MSYCRWSSDDFSCDVYAYADSSGGWTTWVAGSKAVGDIPKVPPWPSADDPDSDSKWAAVVDAQRKQRAFLMAAKREDLGGPFAGQRFNDPTIEAFRARLIAIRDAGYNVPQWVIDGVDREIAGGEGEGLS